jgi:succinoglycan biosynthesis protein ExoO
MSQKPDASIIVAAFNAEQHIACALTSALAQTGGSFEVIVADDASTDGTRAVVERHADERLRLVALAQNLGPGGARNAALEVARGEWVAVLDADDRMAPGRLAKLIRTAQETRADILADNLWVDAGGARRLLIQETLDDTYDEIDFVSYVLHNRPTRPGLGYGYLKPLFRTAFLTRHSLGYDPSLRIGEDFQLVAESLVRGGRYIRQHSAGYTYTKRSGSISHRLGADAAQAMVDADALFLVEHGPTMSPEAKAAMMAHHESTKDAAAFARMLDALRRKRWDLAAVEAIKRPATIGLLSEPIKVRLERLGRGHRPGPATH